MNKRNTIVPASSYASAMHDSSEDDDAEFRNLQFPQEVALQQVSAETKLRQGGPKARNRGCCSVAEIVPFRRCPICFVDFAFDFVAMLFCTVYHQFNQDEADMLQAHGAPCRDGRFRIVYKSCKHFPG